MELIIVRHARPLASQDSADPPLSDLGLRQAELVGERLKGEAISHVISSTMLRAQQTAAPLAKHLGLDIECRDDLREAGEHFGRYKPLEEMAADDPEILAWNNDLESMFSNGYATFKDGVVEAFDDIIAAHRGGTVAVFCHGMVMASYLDALWDLNSPTDILMDYTALFRVKANSTGLRSVRSINETGHVAHLLAAVGSEAPSPPSSSTDRT